MNPQKFGFQIPMLGAIAIVITLVGCGEVVINKTDLEKQSMDQLSASVGQTSPQITCPGDLKAKVGETMVCEMPIKDKIYDVNIKINEVNGTDAKFTVEVAKTPRP
jgi:hypothetical protein